MGGDGLGPESAREGVAPKKRKGMSSFTLGGGAGPRRKRLRPEGRRIFSPLMKELIPQSTFFTQVITAAFLALTSPPPASPRESMKNINKLCVTAQRYIDGFEYFRRI